MRTIWLVYCAIEERWEDYPTREQAMETARASMDACADIAPDEGWPENTDSIRVVEARVIAAPRVVYRDTAKQCPACAGRGLQGSTDQDCPPCEGTGRVSEESGEPWPHGGAYDEIVRYELQELSASPEDETTGETR